MKSFFKCIAVFVVLISTVQARPVVVVTYNKQLDDALIVVEQLKEVLNLPEILISLTWQHDPCKKVDLAVVHICVDFLGKLHFPIFRWNAVYRNLRSFSAKNRVNLHVK